MITLLSQQHDVLPLEQATSRIQGPCEAQTELQEGREEFGIALQYFLYIIHAIMYKYTANLMYRYTRDTYWRGFLDKIKIVLNIASAP